MHIYGTWMAVRVKMVGDKGNHELHGVTDFKLCMGWFQ